MFAALVLSPVLASLAVAIGSVAVAWMDQDAPRPDAEFVAQMWFLGTLVAGPVSLLYTLVVQGALVARVRRTGRPRPLGYLAVSAAAGGLTLLVPFVFTTTWSHEPDVWEMLLATIGMGVVGGSTIGGLWLMLVLRPAARSSISHESTFNA